MQNAVFEGTENAPRTNRGQHQRAEHGRAEPQGGPAQNTGLQPRVSPAGRGGTSDGVKANYLYNAVPSFLLQSMTSRPLSLHSQGTGGRANGLLSFPAMVPSAASFLGGFSSLRPRSQG